jgi:hypothetical protein
MAYRNDVRMGMGCTHMICDSLGMLEPLVVFPSASNDSSSICQHIG